MGLAAVEEMMLDELPSDVITCNLLVSACEKGSMPEWVLQHFDHVAMWSASLRMQVFR